MNPENMVGWSASWAWGSLEALNGWILFGLTTAFLFTVFERAWQQVYGEGRSC